MTTLAHSCITERDEKRALINDLREALALVRELDHAADKMIEATRQAFPQKIAA